jgi:hypothetical protein
LRVARRDIAFRNRLNPLFGSILFQLLHRKVRPYIFDSGLTLRLGPPKRLASCRAKCESNIPAPCITLLRQAFRLRSNAPSGTSRRGKRDELRKLPRAGRGDQRDDIFFDAADRYDFIKTFAEACLKTDWMAHAFCLMKNHYHLVVETPNANLVAGMACLQAYSRTAEYQDS